MKPLFRFLPVALILAVFVGCDLNSNLVIKPPDFKTVPAAYDTTAAVVKFYRADGLKVYTILPGTGDLTVSEVDRVRMFYTLRKMDGKIQESTYANGNTQFPTVLTMSSLIRGFREGLLGQKKGARVVLIIPPALGYGTNPSHPLRNETLRFDIDITEIVD